MKRIRNLEKLLVHGMKYVVVPERGELTRGMPTAYAAPPLSRHFRPTDEPPPIRRVTAPCFLATKLAAFENRGEGDYVMSRDVEGRAKR